MQAPLSRISLFLAILLLGAACFQKSIAHALGNDIVGPTQLEQVIHGGKAAAGTDDSLISVPTHPVQATIFWVAMAVTALALWAWIVEDSFWIPLIAMVLALAAAIFKMALLPAFIVAAAKVGGTQVKRRSTRSTASHAAATTTHRHLTTDK